MELSEKILILMEQKNITAYKIAKDIKIDQSTFSKWKTSPTSDILVTNVKKIANNLGVSIADLLDDEKWNASEACAEDLKKYIEIKRKQNSVDPSNRLYSLGELLPDFLREFGLYIDETDGKCKPISMEQNNINEITFKSADGADKTIEVSDLQIKQALQKIEPMQLTENESKILDLCRKLTEDRQFEVLGAAKMLLKQQEEESIKANENVG